ASCMFFRFICAVLLFGPVPLVAAESRYTLEDCLRIARAQNPDVLIAAKQIDVARGNLTTARAGNLPTLRTDGYFQERQQSLATSGGVNNNRPQDYVLNAGLTQNLYAGGAVQGRISIAKLGEMIATKNYQTAIDNVTLNVKLAFYRVLFADAAVKVRREAVKFMESQVHDQVDRLKAGTVGTLNVTRAKVTLANERPLLYQAEAERATAYILLAQVMGVNLNPGQRQPDFTILGSLVHVQRRYNLAEGLARALANRPEIEARRLEIQSLENQVTVEKAATRPQVNAFGAYQLFSEANPALSPSYFSGFTVGVNFSWTLFDGLATP